MEEDTKEYILRFYLVDRQKMDNDTFKTFNEYFEEMKPQKVNADTRSTEEIMNDILDIEKSFVKGDNNGTV
jgi:wyosine [tRNA(Phe)-imidazoG37] synthetase (radical SAM superfamily)